MTEFLWLLSRGDAEAQIHEMHEHTDLIIRNAIDATIITRKLL